ncbi:MAG: tetratricopeptide repeat protein [Nitrospirae bacterium]|nr:tetratricopeptide repeat protein [Nitrospirota bacterium]
MLKSFLDSILPRGIRLPLAVIAVACIGVYMNTLFCGLVDDDILQVLGNDWIKDVRNLPEIFTDTAWGFYSHKAGNYYRPMMHVVYMFNYHVFGLAPWGFHLVNVLLHFLVTVVAYMLARELLPRPVQPSPVPHATPALVAALLFAVTPIHSESVAWVASVPELVYTLCFLTALYMYIKYVHGFRPGYYISLAAYFVATLAKEPALTLPLVILCYEHGFRRAGERQATYIGRYAPYIAVSLLYLGIRYGVLSGFAPQVRHAGLGAYVYVINVFPLFAKYLLKLLLPVNLNAFHVFHPIKTLAGVTGVVSVAVFIGVMLLAARAFKRDGAVFLALAIIVLPLLPALYIPALGENTFAERYLYLPSFGFTLLAGRLWGSFSILSPRVNITPPHPAIRATLPHKEGWIVEGGCQGAGGEGEPALVINKDRMTYALYACLAAVLCLYAAGTINRNAVWKDDLTLATDMVERSPDGAKPRSYLGSTLGRLGRDDESIVQLKEALRLDPADSEARSHLGLELRKKGQVDQAIEEYILALEYGTSLRPAAILNNLGDAYNIKGQPGLATAQYTEALRLEPDNALAHFNLGLTYVHEGRADDALTHMRIAAGLKPDKPEFRNGLGIAYAEKGMAGDAVREFEEAVRLAPENQGFRENLERARGMGGR